MRASKTVYLRIANSSFVILALMVSLVSALFVNNNRAFASEPWQDSGWAQVSAGGSGACAITQDGFAYCWGNNTGGQLGDGTTTASFNPVAVSTSGVLAGKTLTSIASGQNHVCALASDNNAYCWGANTAGQLGNGTTTSSSVPVAVTMTGVLAGKTVTSITAGDSTTCVTTSDGRAYCWGMGNFGQLGNGLTTNSSVPVAVDMTGVLASKTITSLVSGRTGASCAIASDGKVYCWGYNISGQLGDGTTTNRLVPVAVDMTGVLAGKTVIAVTGGNTGSACVIASDGKVYCWGENGFGQLGNGTTTDSLAPVAVDMAGVLAGKTATAISGSGHACVLASDSKTYCWGNNNSGQLGNGTTTNSSVPVAVDTTGVLAGKTITSITAGQFNTCVLTSDGQAFCWGTNDYGQLGTNAYGTSSVPVPVSPLVATAVSGVQFTTFSTRAALQVSGVAFPPFLSALGQSLVTLNGHALPFCADGIGATAQDLINGAGVPPELVSDTPACYYLLQNSGTQEVMTATSVIVWLPDDFDTAAPGTVSVGGSPEFAFNTPAPAEEPSDPEPAEVPVLLEAAIEQPAPIKIADQTAFSRVTAVLLTADDESILSSPTISNLPTFKGKATPYSTVTVTVHSDPVTCTTQADANGDWECTLATALPVGDHTVTIATTTPDNVTTYLGPYPVRVAGAAPLKQPAVDIVTTPASETQAAQPSGWSFPWLAIAAVVLLVSTIVAVLIHRRQRA